MRLAAHRWTQLGLDIDAPANMGLGNDARFRPGWSRLLLVAWVFWFGAAWFNPELNMWRDEAPELVAGAFFWLGAGIGIQAWRYRYCSDAKERLQTRWVF